MTDLSPAALTVLNAYMDNCGWLDGPLQKDYQCVAAVLRAAADQVVPELGRPRTADERTLYHEGRLDAVIRHRQHLLAIAAELETFND
jgi:hypothetical protein